MRRALLAALAALALPGAASASSLVATLAVRQNAGANPTVELRLDPADAARFERTELLLWMWGAGGRFNRPVEPAAPGVYRLEAPRAMDGGWTYYLRLGAGQAGFVARGDLYLSARPGEADDRTIVLYNAFDTSVPGYVQPVGYAVYGVVALSAEKLIVLVLRSLGARTTPA